MAHIRTWADIEARGGDDWLTPAEQQLIAACKAGERCTLGDGSLPPEGKPAPDRELRAEVLRYLILGGCNNCPVDAIGVWAQGGNVTDHLNLDFCTTKGALRLFNCRFDHRLDTEQTRFAMVALNGSHLNGWFAQGLVSEGGVFLRDITATASISLSNATIGGVLACEKAQFMARTGHALNAQGVNVEGGVVLRDITATATVRLSGASIDGQLACDKAQFMATEGIALNAQGAKVKGGVFLRNIIATATVSLSGATISGQLGCDKAQFKATEGFALYAHGIQITGDFFLCDIIATASVFLNSATIGGQFAVNNALFKPTEGFALDAEGATVSGALVWREVDHAAGAMTFNSAHFRVLADHVTSWSDNMTYVFDGMTYERIAGTTDADSRLEWLAKGSNSGGTFRPQPYTQLAKVMRDMGHDADARKVLARREQLIRAQVRRDMRLVPNGDIDVAIKSLWRDGVNLLRWLFDILLRSVVGYGHHPFRSLVWLIALILLACIPAHYAWEEGSFAPNSGPVLTSEGWLALHADEPNPAEVWSGEVVPANWTPADPETTWAERAPGRDWETFNRYAYAVDVVIPIIDIGQTAAWAPSTTRGPWGWHLWWSKGVLSVMGWIVTALGAAAITGIIRRD